MTHAILNLGSLLAVGILVFFCWRMENKIIAIAVIFTGIMALGLIYGYLEWWWVPMEAAPPPPLYDD